MSPTLASLHLNISDPPLTVSSLTTRTWRRCLTLSVSAPTRIWPPPTARGGTVAWHGTVKMAFIFFVLFFQPANQLHLCSSQFSCKGRHTCLHVSHFFHMRDATAQTRHLLISNEPSGASPLKFSDVVISVDALFIYYSSFIYLV
jgi:hypothetical protein